MKNDEVLEAFTKTDLPVGQLDAYRAGAAQGYLMAKRQMVEAIDNRLEKILQPPIYHEDEVSAKDLEDLRNYIRNVMLWHTA